MKLGAIHPSKYKKCLECNKIIANIRHKKYLKYYQERKNNNDIEKEANTIEEFFVRDKGEEIRIKNLGYIDLRKYTHNIRLFYMNPRGFGPDIYEKLVMLKKNKEQL